MPKGKGGILRNKLDDSKVNGFKTTTYNILQYKSVLMDGERCRN